LSMPRIGDTAVGRHDRGGEWRPRTARVFFS
jgi:hypothetical protein